MSFLSRIKHGFQNAVWPYGSIATIRKGHLKGFKFIVSENSGWSPILGRYESDSHELFSKVIKPGQIVFDLGANNGIHSLLFSKLVGPAGKVFAFEPLPDNIEELKKNFELNNISNITIVPAAVADLDGETTFFLGNDNKQGSIFSGKSQSGREVSVKLLTLRTFINGQKIKPDFIKIDIEGAEADALNGFGEIVNTIKPTFYIELHNLDQDKKVGQILKKIHYSAYRLTEENTDNDLNIPNLQKVKSLDLTFPEKEGIWGTVLAIPNGEPTFK